MRPASAHCCAVDVLSGLVRVVMQTRSGPIPKNVDRNAVDKYLTKQHTGIGCGIAHGVISLWRLIVLEHHAHIYHYRPLCTH